MVLKLQFTILEYFLWPDFGMREFKKTLVATLFQLKTHSLTVSRVEDVHVVHSAQIPDGKFGSGFASQPKMIEMFTGLLIYLPQCEKPFYFIHFFLCD